MPKVEVEEGEFLAAQSVVKAVQGMLGNKESRDLILRAQKIVKPDAVIPEIDARAPVEAALGKVNEELAALRREREEEKATRETEKKTREFEAAWDKQKNTLRQQGYTDEGITKIEEHAAKEGIPNLRAAAADWEKLNPPASPASTNSFDVLSYIQNPPADDAPMKALMESHGDDSGALNSLINNTLSDARSTVQRR